jgi:3-carboxy-cis,cis-muconate cycloisomerase
MMRLAEAVGRQHAHDLVYAACLLAGQRQVPLRAVLLDDDEIMAALSPHEVDDLLDPTRYTGLAAEFVDRIVGR